MILQSQIAVFSYFFTFWCAKNKSYVFLSFLKIKSRRAFLVLFQEVFASTLAVRKVSVLDEMWKKYANLFKYTAKSSVQEFWRNYRVKDTKSCFGFSDGHVARKTSKLTNRHTFLFNSHLKYLFISLRFWQLLFSNVLVWVRVWKRFGKWLRLYRPFRSAETR